MSRTKVHQEESCIDPGCERPRYARERCRPHYERAKRSGLPTREHVRNVGPCSIDGCEREAEKRGLCGAHYQRARTLGHPHRSARPSLRTRLLSGLFFDRSGCIVWTGGTTSAGYGSIGLGGRDNNGLVHRVSYEMFVGPIPVGLELDHLCRNKRCANPTHLEPVTHAENTRRASDLIRAGRWGR